jgi:ribosome-associated heat shock protein Hsp15
MNNAKQEPSSASIRVDRWLWFARFFKSRSLATKLVQSNKLRINSVIVSKSSATIRAGDILTFPQEKEIRVVKILDIGRRRGPAPEAQALYEDLTPKVEKKDNIHPSDPLVPRRDPGAGRPTKADRRAIDKLRAGDDEKT